MKRGSFFYFSKVGKYLWNMKLIDVSIIIIDLGTILNKFSLRISNDPLKTYSKDHPQRNRFKKIIWNSEEAAQILNTFS